MKRLMSTMAAGAVALGVMTFFGVALAAADTTTTTTTTTVPTTTTTLGPPIQGTSQLPIYLQVDTVVGGHSTGVLAPAVGCAQTNEFLVGQTVVFRMSGVNVATGGTPLTPANVASANVFVPGVATPLAMSYGNHGAVAFWTAGWNTAGYPTLGVVSFKLVVTTKAVPAVTKRLRVRLSDGKYVIRTRLVTPGVGAKSYTYTQAGTATPSQLTLNAAPVA